MLTLVEAIHAARWNVWRQQEPAFFEQAIVDPDGTLAPTFSECKQGMHLSYKGEWGYHPLLISLANTKEPLCLVNRSGILWTMTRSVGHGLRVSRTVPNGLSEGFPA